MIIPCDVCGMEQDEHWMKSYFTGSRTVWLCWGLLEKFTARGHTLRPVPGQETTQDICVKEEEKVMWIKMVLLMIVAVLMVICYACLVAASNADRDEHELYEAWKEREKNEAD